MLLMYCYWYYDRILLLMAWMLLFIITTTHDIIIATFVVVIIIAATKDIIDISTCKYEYCKSEYYCNKPRILLISQTQIIILLKY